MSDARLVIRATMKAMIQRFGCYDAVAELLNARWGGGHSKGTISKKASGGENGSAKVSHGSGGIVLLRAE